MSSCGQSAVDIAEQAVRAELRKTLYNFDSYEALETLVDSAYNTIEYSPRTLELYRRYKAHIEQEQEATEALTEAERSLATWEDLAQYGSSISRYEYKRAQQALKEARENLERSKQTGRELELEWQNLLEAYPQNAEFVGWRVEHSYRDKNPDGFSRVTSAIYVFSPDYEQVVLSLDRVELDALRQTISEQQARLSNQGQANHQ